MQHVSYAKNLINITMKKIKVNPKTIEIESSSETIEMQRCYLNERADLIIGNFNGDCIRCLDIIYL